MKTLFFVASIVIFSSTLQAFSPKWAFKNIELNLPDLKGKCDLTPTDQIKQSSIIHQTTVVSELSLPATGANKGCQIKSDTSHSLYSSIVFSSWVGSMLDRSKMILEIKVGDMLSASTEYQENKLIQKGYSTDVHASKREIYKLKEEMTYRFRAVCLTPELTGYWGFRKHTMKCFVSDQIMFELIEK